jgi:hypothetical protein
MSFETPLALALLLAVPIAWWLARARRGAPVVKVASLLAFTGAAETSPSAAPRRAIEVRLVLVLTAMTLAGVAAAGPAVGTSRAAEFYVVVDDSASMSAHVYGQQTLVSRAERILADVHPTAVHEKRRLLRRSTWGGAFYVGPSVPPDPLWSRESDGLPATLARHLDAARDAGFQGIVLVTDAAFSAMPDVAVIGPTAGARTNVAVSAAALDSDEAVVTIRNFGPANVAAVVRSADVSREVAVPALGMATARFAPPDRGEEATIEVNSPADDLPADNRLVVVRRGGVRRAGLFEPSAHVEAALRACGVEIVRGGEGDVNVVRRDEVTYFGVSLEARRTPAKSVVVRGDSVVGRAEFVDVLPAPGTTLVAPTRLLVGEPIWSDAAGALAVATRDSVVLAVDPEDPRSDWHRDPSFPAFVAAALDHVGGGPDRLDARYSIPASESDVVHEPPRTSSPDEIRAVMRPSGPSPDAVRPAPWLALAAGSLLAVAALLRPR